ncbi:MAG: ATPase, T2SS/T4P/T4SS family [Planctomycetota bacterium]
MAETDSGLPVQFVAAGETPKQQSTNLEMVKPSPGYPTCAQLLADAIARRADVAVLDYTPQQVTIRFQIDMVWHTMPPMDRETGDYMMATLKQLAGLDFRDRRSRQEGTFRTDMMRNRFDTRLVTQGIRTGERAAIYIEARKKEPMETLEQLGMREKMIERVTKLLSRSDASMMLVSALPGEGYTTFWRSVLSASDRFTRDYYVIEEAGRVEEEVINITGLTYDESAGETAFTPIPRLLLKQPNVLVFPEVPDGGTVDQICDLSQREDLPMIIRNVGKTCADGLMRLVSLEPDMSKLAENLTGVVSMRLIRKLCPNCRIPFTPNPIFLQKLGIPPGRVHMLYKAFEYQPGMVDEQGVEIPVCHECHGIGYKGLTGLFEFLEIDDEIRALLLSGARMDALMALLQKKNHVGLREEGVVMIARGMTSVEELQRVLKK